MAITLNLFAEMKQKKEKIVMLTCYDAAFARCLDQAGVDILLVGDTLGEVVQGNQTTLSVSIDDMCYHTAMVVRGNNRAFVISDMPFMTYATTGITLKNAAKLMQAGSQMVKMEGGEWLAESVYQLSERGIPTCVHLGLTPQSVHKLGGYRRQGKTPEAGAQLLQDALVLEEAGADLIVLECIPSNLAADITAKLHTPTIGIGAGPHTDGQVLVLYDIIGLTSWKPPGFIQEFFEVCPKTDLYSSIEAYVKAVKNLEYPRGG